MSICGTNSLEDFHGIGSPDTARNTDHEVIEAATPKPIASTISAVSPGLRFRLRRASSR